MKKLIFIIFLLFSFNNSFALNSCEKSGKCSSGYAIVGGSNDGICASCSNQCSGMPDQPDLPHCSCDTQYQECFATETECKYVSFRPNSSKATYHAWVVKGERIWTRICTGDPECSSFEEGKAVCYIKCNPNIIITLPPQPSVQHISVSATNASTNWVKQSIDAKVTACSSQSPCTSNKVAEIRYSWDRDEMNTFCTQGGKTINNNTVLSSPKGGTTLHLCARHNQGAFAHWTGSYNWEDIPPNCGTWTPNPAPEKFSLTSQTFTLTNSTDTGGSGIKISGGTCTTSNSNGDTCIVTISDNAGNTTDCVSPLNNIVPTPFIPNPEPTPIPISGDECRYSDKKLILAGTFITYGGVESARNYRNVIKTQDDQSSYEEGAGKAISNLHPSEVFIYRPDIVVNTPRWMKRSKKIYQEIN